MEYRLAGSGRLMVHLKKALKLLAFLVVSGPLLAQATSIAVPGNGDGSGNAGGNGTI